MGREVRRVPASWQHPRDERGRYRPLYDQDAESAWAEWQADYQAWLAGEFARVRAEYPDENCPADDPYRAFCEWHGPPPNPDYHRPRWADGEATHYMMYETTSEGTPISPAFDTPEKLARWLADTGASAFAGQTADYAHWLRVCRGGYAPSAVITGGREIVSGVEAMGETHGSPTSPTWRAGANCP